MVLHCLDIFEFKKFKPRIFEFIGKTPADICKILFLSGSVEFINVPCILMIHSEGMPNY